MLVRLNFIDTYFHYLSIYFCRRLNVARNTIWETPVQWCLVRDVDSPIAIDV